MKLDQWLGFHLSNPCSSIASSAVWATLSEFQVADCPIVLYGQLRLGHIGDGGQKKRFKDHIKSILKKCNIPFNRLEALASNRPTWRSTCAFGMSCFDAECDSAAALRRCRRHQHAAVLRPISNSVHQCPLSGRHCFSRIGLLSHSKTHFQR